MSTPKLNELLKEHEHRIKTPNVRLMYGFIEDPPRVAIQFMVDPIRSNGDFGIGVCEQLAKRNGVMFKMFDFNTGKAGDEPPSKQHVFAVVVKDQMEWVNAVERLCDAESDYFNTCKKFVQVAIGNDDKNE